MSAVSCTVGTVTDTLITIIVISPAAKHNGKIRCRNG